MTRTQKQWEWFNDIIKEVEEADKKNLVEAHVFVTQFFDKFDVHTTMLVSRATVILDYIDNTHVHVSSWQYLFTVHL